MTAAFSINRCSLPHGFKVWDSHADVLSMAHQLSEEWQGQQALQHQLLKSGMESVQGFCAVCQGAQSFRADVRSDAPNWRESLACDGCGLINRWRASAHLFELLSRTPGTIYVTEQTTSLYTYLARRYEAVVGSEFVAADCAGGEQRVVRGRQIRHEDLTRLSFDDASLAALLSFDVLEHVPDYRAAVSEIARVLQPGGLLLLTAPFSLERQDTLLRAKLGADGKIEHLLPAQYHGDPLSDSGVLCFQEFGWDLLDELRAAGFQRVFVVSVWAPNYGYLDTAQPFIVGWR